MFKRRKGITPVIAIVLLLLITVGAVGVVYSQFQSLTGNPTEKLAQQKKVQNTELTYSSVYKDKCGSGCDKSINVTIRNTGSVTVNVTRNFEFLFVPAQSESGIDYATLKRVSGLDFTSINEDIECFTQTDQSAVLDPGESYTCDTGVPFPGATKSIGLQITFKTADKSWSHTCAPATSGSLTC
ncbi:MAG: archaellin/type IV pilin N-terminal domain-containing protein [Candidatus Nanohaloarchaea archaeon]